MTSCEADTQARIAAIGTKAAADGAIWAPTVAGACVAAIAAADCALVDAVGVRDVLDACDDTWTGVVPPGGTCMTYASCIQPEVAGASTGASCVNQACVQIVRLPVGASCAGASATVNCDPYVAECVGGTCVALPGVGDACTSSCVNADCDGSGQCVARLGMGEVCGGDSACASGKCSAGHCASVFAADSDTCTLP